MTVGAVGTRRHKASLFPAEKELSRMCNSERNQLAPSVGASLTADALEICPAPSAVAGSRRRRIWELDGHAHCPVLGVCLPITVLRRLVGKVLRGEVVADDYELHCGAVADCKFRSPLAEAVQRELDRRYAVLIRHAAQSKTTESLAAWWAETLRCQDIAGPLWATLTHPRCTPALAKQVEGAVHMLQHQAGMSVRIDRQRFVAVTDENAALARELADAQQRSTRHMAEHTRRIEMQQGDILRLRAQLIGRDTVIGALREELQLLEAAAPGLRNRLELAGECASLVERCHALQRSLMQSQQEGERHLRRCNELSDELQRREVSATEAALTDAPVDDPRARLDDRAVLCVGGRPGSVPVYRQLVERTGGRFLHHDGGEEDNSAQLDATLAAADLVICQTGCISHDAYWRVKDHCKRTGKQCVFVETPSSAGLKRALSTLVAQ
jgi:Uncharacterized protein conserved in bacteria (DUF2325)